MCCAQDFNTAGRTIKTGLIAVDIVSHWTWSSTLLQSSNQAFKYVRGYTATVNFSICLGKHFMKATLCDNKLFDLQWQSCAASDDAYVCTASNDANADHTNSCCFEATCSMQTSHFVNCRELQDLSGMLLVLPSRSSFLECWQLRSSAKPLLHTPFWRL